MKTIFMSIKSMLPIAGILFMALGLWSCGGGNQKQAQEQKLKEVKETSALQVEDVIRDVEQRIRFLDGEIENASGELEQELEEARGILKEQKESLNQATKAIKDATYEGWSDVLQKVGATLADARKKTNEVSLKVRNLLDE